MFVFSGGGVGYLHIRARLASCWPPVSHVIAASDAGEGLGLRVSTSSSRSSQRTASIKALERFNPGFLICDTYVRNHGLGGGRVVTG